MVTVIEYHNIMYGLVRYKMFSKKQFTEDDIKMVLKENPHGLMLKWIELNVGCSEMTARNLLEPLIKAGQVEKRDIGASKKRATNLYLWVD